MGALLLSACTGARQPPLTVGDGLELEASGALAVDARRTSIVDAPCPPGRVLVRRRTTIACEALPELSGGPQGEELERTAATLATLAAEAAVAEPPTSTAPLRFVPGACPQHREEVQRGAIAIGSDGRVTPSEVQWDPYGLGGYCPVRLGPSGGSLRKLIVHFIDPDGLGANAFVDVHLVELSPGGQALTIAQVEPGNLGATEVADGEASRSFAALDPETKTYAIEYSLKWADADVSGPPSLLAFELAP